MIRKAEAMTSDRNDRTGFAPPRRDRRHGRRSTAFAQLITSVALALSIGVATTAVSMGIARADGIVAVAQDSNAHVAIARVRALDQRNGVVRARELPCIARDHCNV